MSVDLMKDVSFHNKPEQRDRIDIGFEQGCDERKVSVNSIYNDSLKTERSSGDPFLRTKAIVDRSLKDSFTKESIHHNRVLQEVNQQSARDHFKKYAINLCKALENEILPEFRDLISHSNFKFLTIPENYYLLAMVLDKAHLLGDDEIAIKILHLMLKEINSPAKSNHKIREVDFLLFLDSKEYSLFIPQDPFVQESSPIKEILISAIRRFFINSIYLNRERIIEFIKQSGAINQIPLEGERSISSAIYYLITRGTFRLLENIISMDGVKNIGLDGKYGIGQLLKAAAIMDNKSVVDRLFKFPAIREVSLRKGDANELFYLGDAKRGFIVRSPRIQVQLKTLCSSR